MPRKKKAQPVKKYEKITVGWNSNEAVVSDDYCSIDVKYSYQEDNCCCGECWPSSYGSEGEATFEMDRSDVVLIAKTMGIKPEELA